MGWDPKNLKSLATNAKEAVFLKWFSCIFYVLMKDRTIQRILNGAKEDEIEKSIVDQKIYLRYLINFIIVFCICKLFLSSFYISVCHTVLRKFEREWTKHSSFWKVDVTSHFTSISLFSHSKMVIFKIIFICTWISYYFSVIHRYFILWLTSLKMFQAPNFGNNKPTIRTKNIFTFYHYVSLPQISYAKEAPWESG